MNYDLNLERIDLESIRKEDIKTFRDFSMLVCAVRGKLRGFQEEEFIYRYYDIMLFLGLNFPITESHFDYFSRNSKLTLSEKGVFAENVLSSYRKTLQEMNKDGYSFPSELRLRPLESTFSFETNLTKGRFKKEYVPKETFKTLIDKFWFFVDYVRQAGLIES